MYKKWSNKCTCAWDRFLLLLPNQAFGKVQELNCFIWFVAISVSRQFISCGGVLNVRTFEIQYILPTAKFLWWFQSMMGRLYLFCYLLGQRLRLILESVKVLFQYGFSECSSCFTLLSNSLGADLLQQSFDGGSWLGFRWWYSFSFRRIPLETDVEVDKGSARDSASRRCPCPCTLYLYKFNVVLEFKWCLVWWIMIIEHKISYIYIYIHIFTWKLICYIFNSLIFRSRIVYRIPNLAAAQTRD